MRDYILKEYGAWSVLVLSYAAGLMVSGSVCFRALFAFLGLAILINAKQAFTIFLRRKAERQQALSVLSLQILIGALLLIIAFAHGMLPKLFPYAVIPALYLALIFFVGEHNRMTELAGFATLTLASLLAYAAIAREIDLKLYLAVALYFSASVFRVKLQLRKTDTERYLMAGYVVVAVILYIALGMSPLILLPLLDNLALAAFMYTSRLRITGWIEVAKGIAFVLLLWRLY